MRKRRFKKRGRSQQSRVYGFLALHTNFAELRKGEVRRIPIPHTRVNEPVAVYFFPLPDA
jgi:hypothetical protein